MRKRPRRYRRSRQDRSDVVDGITSLVSKVFKHYPDTSFQKCVTHLKRNIINKVRPKDKSTIPEDLNCIFDITDNQYTKEEAYKISKEVALR